MSKAQQHISQNKLPCIVQFKLLKIKVSAEKKISLRPRVTRGDKQASQLDTFEIEPQQCAKVFSYSTLQTSFDITIFVLHNAPLEKQCKVDFMVVDSEGLEKSVVASLEFNVEDHLGADYAERTYRATQTQIAKGFGINVVSIRVRIDVEPVHSSEHRQMTLFKTCENWRSMQGAPEIGTMRDDLDPTEMAHRSMRRQQA